MYVHLNFSVAYMIITNNRKLDQTGSGKTYTIWGPSNALLEENLSSDQQGLTPRVFERLFARIDEVCVRNSIMIVRSVEYSVLHTYIGSTLYRSKLSTLTNNFVISAAVLS